MPRFISLKFCSLLLYSACLLLLQSCATSPTGRSQLMLFPDSQMDQMGVAAFNSMKGDMPRATDSKQVEYVRCITDQLLKFIPADLQQKQWEVEVFVDESPNAFALPGGKIGVHTGMLSVAETPGQLAAVLGHEIGHVWANHGNERMSQNTFAQLGMQVATVLAGEPSAEKQMALGALGIASQGTVLKFSRVHESEADKIGLDIMAKAGFDPQQAVSLWENMASSREGGRPPEFFSTHPSEKRRIKDLRKELNRVMPIYQTSANRSAADACQPASK